MLRVALIQMLVKASKPDSINAAMKNIKRAANNGAKLVCLPECFNSLYGVKHFGTYAEEIPNGETCSKLSDIAKEMGIWLIGGSIPEKRGDKLYNTSVAYAPDGTLIGQYSKIHLFDIDVPGKIRFQESEVLSSGSNLLSFPVKLNETDVINVGIGICYDIRFPELAHIYSRSRNCSLILYPGAFNMTTGPAHWELLTRARAVDNQCYVGVCSIARDEQGEYIGYGHSMVAGPWGSVIRSLGPEEGILEFDVDMSEIKRIRESIPTSTQRRTDVYTIAKEL